MGPANEESKDVKECQRIRSHEIFEKQELIHYFKSHTIHIIFYHLCNDKMSKLLKKNKNGFWQAIKLFYICTSESGDTESIQVKNSQKLKYVKIKIRKF